MCKVSQSKVVENNWFNIPTAWIITFSLSHTFMALNDGSHFPNDSFLTLHASDLDPKASAVKR